VVISELVDDLQKGAQGLRVAVRQIGVLEDVAKERGMPGFSGILEMASAYRFSVSWPPRPERISFDQP
jgi:hypothetical protein